MKKLYLLFAIVLMLVTLVACGGSDDIIIDENSYVYSQNTLVVTGDVAVELELDDYSNFDTTTVVKNDETLLGVLLSDVLASANMYDASSSVMVAAYDGVMAELSVLDIADCVLVSSSANGWQLVAPSHSPQAGVKDIEYIVVIAQTIDDSTAVLGIIDDDQDTVLSYGQLFLQDGVIVNVLESTASSYDIDTGVYNRLEVLPISQYITSSDYVVGYFSDGSQKVIEADGYIEWRGNSADYISANGKSRTAGIIGIWADAPELCLTDVASTVASCTDDVLIIEIDGLGMNTLYYHNWSYLASQDVETMRVVMPSISNVGIAAIVTGKTPDINGVAQLGDRELLVDDIFVGCDSCFVVEGSSSLINMSIDQQLNSDLNNSGSNDDEVYASAMAVIGQYQLTYVHFHGYDDFSHNYGPYSDEVAVKALELDAYVKAMVEAHTGTVIIVSDHGQHDTGNSDKLGAHGTFIYEDMTVPYIVIYNS